MLDAAVVSNSFEVVRLLFAKGASLKQTALSGDVLVVAVAVGNLEMLKYLVERGAAKTLRIQRAGRR